MELRSWPWWSLVLATMAYWVVVAAASYVYLSRPGLAARQERARMTAQVEMHPGTDDGERRVTLSYTIDLTRVLAVLLVPPALLTLGWLIARTD
jgi:hypothetical protein